MAYTNTPEQSTYRTLRFDLAGMPSGRSGGTTNKDQKFLNAFPESFKDPTTRDKKFFLRSRPGAAFSTALPAAGEGRGIMYFNGSVYSVVGNKLYRDTTSVQTLATTTGPVGFTLFNGSYTALILVDGTDGYVIKTDNSVTKITDPDFPTPHIATPVFLDGYLFLAKSGTDDIYNCDLEDPLSWTPGKFITAELYPDKVIALAKNANYVVAVGERTTEQFYDAGNASGSPLQRNDSAVQQVGTPAPFSVVSSDGEVLLVGTTQNGGYTVWLIKGFEYKELGTPFINQALTYEGVNLAQAVGCVVRSTGHKFYILTTLTRTFVFDLDEQMWHEWASGAGTSPFAYRFVCDHNDGKPRLLHNTGGFVAALTDNIATDATSSSTTETIYTQVLTDKIDISSNNRKTCNRLSMVGDAPNGTANVLLNVSWSDDDYNTWTADRPLYLNGDLQAITQLGMFRRRAFRFTYNQPYPIRLEGFELDINIGQK